MGLNVGEISESSIIAGSLRELAFERQGPLPAAYKRVKLDCGYRVDIVVEGKSSAWDGPLTLPSPQRGEGSGLRLPLPCGERARVRGISEYLIAALKQGLRRKVL